MQNNEFRLPSELVELVTARNKLREHYRAKLKARGCSAELKFTFDGNLVGDIGEAVAVELFGIALVEAKSVEGIDGYTADRKRTVQIKATSTGRGPAFRQTETRADHLLFFEFDFESALGKIIFNGPEHLAVKCLPETFNGQRMISMSRIRRAALEIKDEDKLPIIS